MAACPDDDSFGVLPAARVAATYAPTVGGVSVTGWFLPSLDELKALDISSVGGLTPLDYYWSSSQIDASGAWRQYVGMGGGGTWWFYDVKDGTHLVRAVRAF
jgi:hypothetical protein